MRMMKIEKMNYFSSFCEESGVSDMMWKSYKKHRLNLASYLDRHEESLKSTSTLIQSCEFGTNITKVRVFVDGKKFYSPYKGNENLFLALLESLDKKTKLKWNITSATSLREELELKMEESLQDDSFRCHFGKEEVEVAKEYETNYGTKMFNEVNLQVFVNS